MTPAPHIAPAFIASAGVSNVILTSVGHFQLASHELNRVIPPTERNLGLTVIEHGLKERGFHRVSTFQPNPNKFPDLERNGRGIISRFGKMGAAERGAVIGIGTTADEYFKFVLLSRMLRQAFPDAQIVAGGAHFFRQSIDGHPDTVEIALMEGLADAIQVGHARAFIDFITRHDGDLALADGSGFYRLDPGSKGVLGKGRGKLPRLRSVPFLHDKSRNTIDLILMDACRNGCSFCSASSSGRHIFSADVAIRSLSLTLNQLEPIMINIQDPNPYDEKDLDYYAKIFRALDGVRPTAKGGYFNPGLLVSDDHRARLLDLFQRHRIWFYFAGRDAVVEKSARAIGSRYGGKLKDQTWLDAEREAMLEFMRRMVRSGSTIPGILDLDLSYIVSPFDDADAFRAVIADLVSFAHLKEGGVGLKVAFFPLTPYPGTKLRKKLKDMIHLDDLDFLTVKDGVISPWREGAGPGLPLMAEIPEIHRRGDAENSPSQLLTAAAKAFDL